MTTILDNPTLVLNKGWSPINVIPVHRAICLTFSEKAQIIDPLLGFQQFTWNDWANMVPNKDEKSIKAGKDIRFRIPEVILLNKYDKLHNRKVNFCRRELYRRDEFQCQYCGARPGAKELSVDHIHPRSLGGKTTWENCVVSCMKCNAKKANMTLQECKMTLMNVPVRPKHNLYHGQRKNMPKSWKSWESLISEAYWEIELDNDN